MKDIGFTNTYTGMTEGGFVPEDEAALEPCPLCAKYTDPVTGELHLNAETIAAIEEGRAMMRGEIPANRYHSVAEIWEELGL